jgi:hypothetical protein
MLPDYSEYLDKPGNFAVEQLAWERISLSHQGYVHAAEMVLFAAMGLKAFHVHEWCFGGARIPIYFNEKLEHGLCSYSGVDKSVEAVQHAESLELPGCQFVQGDIRGMQADPDTDIVCCFQALKHFSLEEWNSIFDMVLQSAPIAVFTMNISENERDDGTDWPHVWVTDDHMLKAIERNEHYVSHQESIWLDPSSDDSDVLFITRKK